MFVALPEIMAAWARDPMTGVDAMLRVLGSEDAVPFDDWRYRGKVHDPTTLDPGAWGRMEIGEEALLFYCPVGVALSGPIDSAYRDAVSVSVRASYRTPDVDQPEITIRAESILRATVRSMRALVATAAGEAARFRRGIQLVQFTAVAYGQVLYVPEEGIVLYEADFTTYARDTLP